MKYIFYYTVSQTFVQEQFAFGKNQRYNFIYNWLYDIINLQILVQGDKL